MSKIEEIKRAIDKVLSDTGTDCYHEVTIYGDGGDPEVELNGEYTVETLEKICSLLRLAQNSIRK